MNNASKTLIAIVITVLLIVIGSVLFNAQQSHAATIIQTQTTDTLGTFRTNVNTSLVNLNTGLTAIAPTNATSTEPLMAKYYVATSTLIASQFPYASSTAISVSGSAFFPGSGIWNSSGNVGIGIAPAASTALTVNGTLVTGNGLRSSVDANDTAYFQNALNYTQFHMNNTAGTTEGYVSLSNTGSANMGQAGDDTTAGMQVWTVGSRRLTLGTNRVDRLTILGTGNIGIGSTSPSSALSVNGFVNVDGKTGGYKQDSNTILYASSTISAIFGGQGAGAGVITIATSSSNSSGPFSTAFGFQAFGNATSSALNGAAFGYQACQGSATISGSVGLNSCFGSGAGSAITSGNQETLLGYKAGGALTSGSRDVFIGPNTGGGTLSTSDITAVGANALTGATGATQSTCIGSGACGVGAIGPMNSVLGFNAMLQATGQKNTIFGSMTATTTTAGNNNLAFGYDLGIPSGTNNYMTIGNLIYGTSVNGEGTTISTGSIGIASTTPWGRLSIKGSDTSASTLAFAVSDSSDNVLAKLNDAGLLTITNASTTNLTVGTFAALPTNSACSGFALGSFCVDTTDNQIQVGTSTSPVPAVYSPYRYITFTAATTSWVGTTTQNQVIAPFSGSIKDIKCKTDAGTVIVQTKINSTNLATINASTTANFNVFTASNTFVTGDIIETDMGNPATSPTVNRCVARTLENAS